MSGRGGDSGDLPASGGEHDLRDDLMCEAHAAHLLQPHFGGEREQPDAVVDAQLAEHNEQRVHGTRLERYVISLHQFS